MLFGIPRKPPMPADKNIVNKIEDSNSLNSVTINNYDDLTFCKVGSFQLSKIDTFFESNNDLPVNESENVFGAVLNDINKKNMQIGKKNLNSVEESSERNINSNLFKDSNPSICSSSLALLPKFNYVSLMLDDYFDKDTSIDTKELAFKYLKDLKSQNSNISQCTSAYYDSTIIGSDLNSNYADEDDEEIWLFGRPPQTSIESNVEAFKFNEPIKSLTLVNKDETKTPFFQVTSGGKKPPGIKSSGRNFKNKNFSDEDEDERDVTKVLDIEKLKSLPKLL
jgi:hypothetical protein